MKSIVKLALLPLLAIGLVFTSCKKDDPDPEPPVDAYADLYKIGEADLATVGYKLTLYMDEEPYTGYNRVYAVVKDKITNQLVENVNVEFKPMMDMGSMSHTAPLEQPVWDATTKAYKGTVTFTMPSANGTWYLTIKVTNPTTLVEEEHEYTLVVIDKDEARLYSFVSTTDGAKIIVALVEPPKWKTGMNDFEVVVYKKASMTDFPAMTDLQIEITPEMPTMGHGSPNNVNPTHVANGHYKGQVNFTMTGYWKVNIVIKDANGAVMNNTGFFDITFNNIY